MSIRFTSYFEMLCNVFHAPICISTLFEKLVVVTHLYHACAILFMGFRTLIDLVLILFEIARTFGTCGIKRRVKARSPKD